MRSVQIPRLLGRRVRAALADAPVVLIHGPRQSGKTTLARLVGERRGYRYVSFDEDAVRAAAERVAASARRRGEGSGTVTTSRPRSSEMCGISHASALWTRCRDRDGYEVNIVIERGAPTGTAGFALASGSSGEGEIRPAARHGRLVYA